MELIRKVKKVLKENNFTDKELRSIEAVSQGLDRISGFIISERFKDMWPTERQDLIWDIFERELTPVEKSHILMILTLTPQEEEDHRMDEGGGSGGKKSRAKNISKTRPKAVDRGYKGVKGSEVKERTKKANRKR